MVTDNINEPSNLDFAVPQINSIWTSISNNMDPTSSEFVQNSLQHIQHIFPSDYKDPIFILVECTDVDKNLGRWHSVR